MLIKNAAEIEGKKISTPYSRTLKTIFGPDADRGGIKEIMFNQALIDPGSRTDWHKHDRPELIYVVSGEGVCVSDKGEPPIREDSSIWVPAEEFHQIKNKGDNTLKLATLFLPGYKREELIKGCEDAAQRDTEKS